MTVRGRARTPIPVAVLTGYLGAGKTTLLSRLLGAPEMADTAVVINEFGEIGLDHLLVESADEGVVELSGGCLCCRVSGDLISTLEDLLRRRDNDRVKPFRRVVIETSGLADPAPVMQAVMLHPYISLRYRLSSVVTAVDALTGMASLDRHRESVRQAALADILVVTKTDLIDRTSAGDGLIERLRALNPRAVVLDGQQDELDTERMFGDGFGALRARVGDGAAAAHSHDHAHASDRGHAHAYASDHDHAHAHDRGHDHVHDERIGAVSIRETRPIGRAALDGFLDLVRSQYGPGVLRIKGLVLVDGEPEKPLVIHGVQHVLHPPSFLDEWPDGERTTRLVVITDGIDAGKIEALFAAFMAEDGAAGALVADNPLAIPGAGPYRP